MSHVIGDPHRWANQRRPYAWQRNSYQATQDETRHETRLHPKFHLDADDKVIDRKAIPYPYPQRLDAVETIEKLITRLQKAHYEAERDYWSAIA
jgi:hypothetical protein